MNRSLIMKALAVLSAVFGVAMLLSPNGLMAVYGAEQMNGPGVLPLTALLNVLIFLVFTALFAYLEFAHEAAAKPTAGPAH